MTDEVTGAPSNGGPARSDLGVVKSATRVLDLFELLGQWDAEKTHTEIAEALAIPKSSLTQLLKTLVRRGYLDYAAETKGYSIGPSIAELAQRRNKSRELVVVAGQMLEWIKAETQESCALNFFKGDRSEVVAAVMSSHVLVTHMRLGDTAPLYATSGGKALLAFLPDDLIQEYLGRIVFEKITSQTIDTTDQLKAELAAVRQSGTALVMGEFTPGIAGVAQPILSASGHPMASINIAVPMARFDEAVRSSCTRILGQAVATIRRQLHMAR